jgi:hypothetical protein
MAARRAGYGIAKREASLCAGRSLRVAGKRTSAVPITAAMANGKRKMWVK